MKTIHATIKHTQEEKNDIEQNSISLSKYLENIKNHIERGFSIPTFVTCEIISINSKSGIYYFEVSDTFIDYNGNEKKVRAPTAILYADKVFNVITKFNNTTGMELSSGMKVMFQMKTTYSVQYGMSLQIVDIEPNFTIGEIEIKRNQIKQQASIKGFANNNKSKKLPKIFKSIAVISPSNAAGLGDFKVEADILEKYDVCKFHYFHATFEGNNTEKSIADAFIQVFNSGFDNYDCLVIIRGGGSKQSLQQLDEWRIVASVCKCPIPVISGIGHERDKVLIDEFSALSIDTPSKVIEFIKNSIFNEFVELNKNHEKINSMINLRIKTEMEKVEYLKNYINSDITSYVNGFKNRIDNTLDIVKSGIENKVEFTLMDLKNSALLIKYKLNEKAEQNKLLIDSAFSRIETSILNHSNDFLKDIDFKKEIIEKNIIGKMEVLKSGIDGTLEVINESSPDNTLKKGYAIVRDKDNKIITDINVLKDLVEFKITLKNGNHSFKIQKH